MTRPQSALRRTALVLACAVGLAAGFWLWPKPPRKPAGPGPFGIVLETVDPGGTPLAGCELRGRAEGPGTFGTWGPWQPREALTRPSTAPGPGLVQVRCPGRAPLQQRLEAPRRHRFVLAPGGRLAGTVRDEDGTALAGTYIELRAAALPEWEPWKMVTGADGSFEFTALPRSSLELTARVDGHESLRRWLTTLPSAPMAITLPRVATLRVHVEGAGAEELWVTGQELWPARKVVLGPGQGQGAAPIDVSGLPSGEYQVWARGTSAISAVPVGAEATAGQVTSVRISVIPRPGIRGQVRARGRAATAIGGADVQLLPPEPSLPMLRARSDAGGHFQLPAPWPRSQGLWAHAEGYVDSVAAMPNPGTEASVILRATLTLTGKVVSAEGAPVPGASVSATGPTGAPVTSSWAGVLDPLAGELGVTQGPVPRVPLAMAGSATAPSSVKTDASGAFRIAGLTATAVHLHASHPDYADAHVAFEAGRGHETARLVLRRAGAVRGTVRDLRGFEVAGIDVRLQQHGGAEDRWTVSDAHGEFQFGNLLGTAAIDAFEHGDATAHCEISVDAVHESDCELQVGEPRSSVEVRVVDSAGYPVHGARLALRRASATGQVQQRLTGPDGSATFAALMLSEHHLDVTAAGLVSLTGFAIDPSADEASIRVSLETAGEIAGVVLDSLGEPVAGADIRAKGAAPTLSSEFGEFVLAGLPSGDRRVHARHGPLQTPTTSVRVRGGERIEGIRLVLDGRADSVVAATDPESDSADSNAGELEPVGVGADAAVPDVLDPPPTKPLQIDSRGGDAVVTHVAADSSAGRAGLRSGDVITHVDDERVLSASQARGMLRDPPGRPAQVRIRRGKSTRTLTLRRPKLR